MKEYRYDGLGRHVRDYRFIEDTNWDVKEYYFSALWQILETTRSEDGGVSRGSPAAEPLVATREIRGHHT